MIFSADECVFFFQKKKNNPKVMTKWVQFLRNNNIIIIISYNIKITQNFCAC